MRLVPRSLVAIAFCVAFATPAESRAAIPATPTQLSPASGSSVTAPPKLTWTISSGATSYPFQCATSSSFSSSTLVANGSSPTANITLTQTNLVVGNTYYWRVAAKNSAGVSPWSSTWSFKIVAPPPPPDLAALNVDGPSSAMQCQTVNVSFAIGHTGSAFTPPIGYSIRLGTSQSISVSDPNVSGFLSVPGPGAYTKTIQIPCSFAPGTYYWGLVVTTDPDEVNTSNNKLADLNPITISAQPASDPAVCVAPNAVSILWEVGTPKPAAVQLAISNCGSGSLTWQGSVLSGASWLSLGSTQGGPLNAGGSQTVSVSVDPTALGEGTYSGSVRFVDKNDVATSVTVPFTLTVNPPDDEPIPALCVSPTEVHAELAPGGFLMVPATVTNCGDTSMQWMAVATSAKPWLKIGPPTVGTLAPGASVTLPLTISTTGASTGTQSTVLRVFDAEVPTIKQDVPIELTVGNAVSLGGLTLVADSLTTVSDGQIQATGNVSIGRAGKPKIVTTSSSVMIDPIQKKLTFTGSLKSAQPLASKTLTSGSCQATVNDTTLELTAPQSAGFALAGLPWTVEAVEFEAQPDRVVLAGAIDLPPPLPPVEFDLPVSISASGVAIESGCVTFAQPLALPKSPWKLKALTFCLDPSASQFTVDGAIDVGWFVLDCWFTVANGKVDAMSLCVDLSEPVHFGPPAPQFCSPLGAFAWTNGCVKLQNLAGNAPLYIEGAAGFAALHDACLPPPLKITVVDADPIVLGFDVSGHFAFNGAMSLFKPSPSTPIKFKLGPIDVEWTGYPCAKVVAHASKADGFVIDEAWLDLLNIVVGKIEYFTVDKKLLWGGKGSVKLQLPTFVPAPFGGLQLADAKAQFATEAMWASASVFSADVAVLAKHDGGVEFAVDWDPLGGLVAASSGDSGPGTFTEYVNDAAGATLLVGARWTQGEGTFELNEPSGAKWSESKLPADGRVRLYHDDEKRLCVFTVRHADAGSYRVASTGSPPMGTTWFGLRRNADPHLEFTDDSGAGVTYRTAGDSLTRYFAASDAEADPLTVTFHLSDVFGVARGREIGSTTLTLPGSEPVQGGAAIELPSDLSPGDYFLYASVGDGRHAPTQVFSKGTLRVSPPVGTAPDMPTIEGISTQDHALLVTLGAGDAPGTTPPTAFVVYYTETSVIDGAPRRAVTADSTALLDDAPAGATLRVWARAVDAEGRHGPATEPVIAKMPTAADGSSAPRFVQVPVAVAKLGSNWSTIVAADDADGVDGLELDILDNPGIEKMAVAAGVWSLSLSSSIEVSGIHPIRLRLRDPEGHAVERDWLLHVQGREAGNVAPTLVSAPPVVVPAGVYSEHALDAIDVDAMVSPFGGSATVELVQVDGVSGSSAWAHQQGASMTFTPSVLDAGPHELTVRVVDDEGASSTVTYGVFVEPDAVADVVPLGAPMFGELDELTDIDDARFLGVRGTKIAIKLAQSGPAPIVRIVDEHDGEVIAQGKAKFGKGAVKAKLPRSGWFRIEVTSGPSAIGPYALEVKSVVPANAKHVKKKIVAKKDGTARVKVRALPGALVAGTIKPVGSAKGTPAFSMLAPDAMPLADSEFTAKGAKKRITVSGLKLWAIGDYTVVVGGLKPKSDVVLVDLTIDQAAPSLEATMID